MIILLFVSLFLICLSLYFFYQANRIQVEKSKLQKDLQAETKQLSLEIKQKYKEKADLIQRLQIQHRRVQSYYDEGKAKADNELKIYIDYLKNQQQKDQELYEEGRRQLEASLTQVRAELDKLKATRDAAQKALLREAEVQQQKEYYTLQLDDKSLHDIHILKSVEENLYDPRPLRMTIWTSCYSKKVNDLCSRVFGTTTKTGIYKITYLPTNQCYIGQAKDLKERIREHCKAGFTQIDTPANNKLYALMKKADISDFTFELVQECPADQLNQKQKFYIDLYSAYNYGLNSNRGNSK